MPLFHRPEPVPVRPLDPGEAEELREGAQNLRAWADRNQHEDPAGAATRRRWANANEARANLDQT